MRKKPEKLSATLQVLLRARGMEGRLSEYRILGVWDKCVGRVIAGHARPAMVKAGKLYLTVDSAAWMQQLAMLKPEIAEKVNHALGKETIKGIVLNLGEVGPVEPAKREAPVAQELSAEERSMIEQHLGEVSDPGIRQSIRRVIEKDLMRKKAKQK